MSVVLIFEHDPDGKEETFAERVHTVVLPSRKVITKDGSDDIAEMLSRYEDRWREEPTLRENVASLSKNFFEENFDGEIPPPDEDDKDFPLAAFYWMVLSAFDTQIGSSAIFADEDAKDILREGGWFNA